MKKILPLAILVMSVVAISGCTNQTNNVVGNGLEITSFGSDQTTVVGSRTVRISMDVENLGDLIVDQAASMAYLTGSNVVTGSSDETAWSSATENDVKGLGKSLKPADVAREIPADKKTITWSLTSPTLPRGQTRTDTFIGRVYYDYQTILRGTVWAYPEAEADAARSKGEGLSSSSFTTTKGPLSISASVAPDPVLASDSDLTFTVYFTLSNVGKGTAFEKGSVSYDGTDLGIDYNQLNVIEFGKDDIVVTGASITSCDNDADQTVELVNGQATLACEMSLDSMPPTMKGYALTATVSYGYYQEQTTSIEVSGK